jgi:two-component system OmpR family response regulator
MTNQILLVEDDDTLGYVLQAFLEMKGFGVKLASTGREGLKLLRKSVFDLCILDVMMPELDGFALAKAMKREGHAVPFLFLTARSLKSDKLEGFDLGADDYIVKPVDEDELLARIKAVLRRANQLKEEAIAPFEIGAFTFDYNNLKLTHKEISHQLTEREGMLLRLLCEHKGQILPRQKVLDQVWRQSDYFTRRSMDVFISRLRKYLGADPNIQIRNVYGKGFILMDDVEDAER